MTRRTPEQIRETRIASFLTIADEEFVGATKLIDPLPKQAAFLMQQTVEKLTRAVLEREGIPAGPTHSIEALASMLPVHHVLRQRLMSFDDLSGAATRYRYPTEAGALREPDKPRLVSRLADIETLRRDVVAFVKRT
jgi:HEPN domain-containing protein